MLPFQDHRIIQQHGAHAVHAQRCEVMFRDGSAVGLHPVSEDGNLQMFLRAVQTEGLQWAIFDVRAFGPEVEADIKSLPPRDAHGVVFYTLRARCRTAAEFHAELRRCTQQAWWAAPAPSVGERLALA